MGKIFLVYIDNSLYCKCKTCIVSKTDVTSRVETVYGDSICAYNVHNTIKSFDTLYYSLVKSYTVYLFDPDAIKEQDNECNKIYCKCCMEFLGWTFVKQNTRKYILMKRKMQSI